MKSITTITRMTWPQARYQLVQLRYAEEDIADCSFACPGPGMEHTMPGGKHAAGTDSGGLWYITTVPDRPVVPCGSEAPESMPWPDLTRDWDVAEICAALRVVDAYLDANTAQAYRDQPLAGHMSRIGKAQSEAREAMEALAGVTGENPRKGVCDTWEHVLEELGDTACAALLGIQHVTKDTDVTWAVFIAALSKALRRVPGPRPAPTAITTEGDQ